MVRRLSNVSESRLTSTASIETNYPHERIKPFPKPSPFVFFILLVILGFIGNVSY